MRDPAQAQHANAAILLTADLLRRRFGAVVEPYGITLQQYNVLRILVESGSDPMPTLEIGARLLEQTPGITRLLDRLEAKDLIERKRGSGDRRLVHCSISPAGEALVREVGVAVGSIHDACFAGFDPDEVDAFLEMLEAVRLSVE